jgi:hypothetical protein
VESRQFGCLRTAGREPRRGPPDRLHCAEDVRSADSLPADAGRPRRRASESFRSPDHVARCGTRIVWNGATWRDLCGTEFFWDSTDPEWVEVLCVAAIFGDAEPAPRLPFRCAPFGRVGRGPPGAGVVRHASETCPDHLTRIDHPARRLPLPIGARSATLTPGATGPEAGSRA